MSSKNYTRFLSTYSGRDLLKKHSLTDTGFWHIRGEDPNCDMGGSHYHPDLGVVEGTLKDVIEYAVELKNFWQWGAGGNITCINITKVNAEANKHRQELTKEAEKLEARLSEIKQTLKEF